MAKRKVSKWRLEVIITDNLEFQLNEANKPFGPLTKGEIKEALRDLSDCTYKIIKLEKIESK